MLCAQARDASSDANGDKALEGGLPHKPLAPIKSKASGKYNTACCAPLNVMLSFCKLLLMMIQQSLHAVNACLHHLALPSLHSCHTRDMLYYSVEALLQTTAFDSFAISH